MGSLAAPRRAPKAAMKCCPLPILALLVVSALPPGASAQAAATPAVAAASTAPLRMPGTRPAPRRQSATESSANAAAPGELRPERPVTPQISIPLGKTAPAPLKTPARAPRAGSPAPAGGVDDAAARCQAEEDASLRAECRARLAPAKLPK